MKIIDMSDIHGDFETFDKALELVKASDAEVLAINGDLSGSVFEGKEKSYFMNIVNNVGVLAQQIYQNTNGQTRTFHDAVKFLISERVKAPDEVKQLARDYLDLERIGKERMLNQYQGFKERFDKLEQKVVLVIGNWDGKCIDDVLAHENIHNKYYEEVNGIKFIGYGGAREQPNELPVDLTVGFNKDEAYTHLSKFEDAEVALMHAVPRHFEGNNRHIGEYSLLAYLKDNAPSLILTGHTHFPLAIVDKKTGTLVVNPGNLGRYEDEDFGTFLELEIDNNYFVNLETIYKINGNSVETCEFKEKVLQ